MTSIQIVREGILRSEVEKIAAELFGDLAKAVVDVHREVMAIGGELHSDEEALLLEDGSRQEDLWGINIYPSLEGEEMIEFDSMINVRPRQGNRSRSVESPETRSRIITLVHRLVREERS
jgi:hypothetical protein